MSPEDLHSNQPSLAQSGTAQSYFPDKETLRSVLANCHDHHKYFVTFRNTVTAGYVAVLGGIGLALKYALWERSSYLLAAILCFAGFWIGVALWVIERRNRKLYGAAQTVGQTVEAALFFETNEQRIRATFKERIKKYEDVLHDGKTENMKLINIPTGAVPFGFFSSLQCMHYSAHGQDLETEKGSLIGIYLLNVIRIRKFFLEGVSITHSFGIDILFSGSTLALLFAGAYFVFRSIIAAFFPAFSGVNIIFGWCGLLVGICLGYRKSA